MNGWQVSRETLLRTLEILEQVPARLGITSSEFYRVERISNRVTRWTLASDATGSLDVAGTGEWPKPAGAFFLNRKTFTPFVQVAKEIKNKAPFVFKLNGKALIVRHGRRKAVFNSQPTVDGYPEKLSSNSLNRVELSDHAKGLIYCARDCASGDQLTPELHCVYVQPRKNSIHVFARNQRVQYRASFKTTIDVPEAFPFPLFLVTLLESKYLKAIEWKKGLLVLQFPGGEIWQPVSSKAINFPYDSVAMHMAEGSRKTVLFRVESRRLALALQRLGLYLQAVKREDWLLHLRGKKGETDVQLSAEIAHVRFNERVLVDGVIGEDFTLDWPLDQLVPVFEYVGQKNRKLWLEVRLWKAKTKSGKRVLASYVKTGDVELVIPSKRV